MKVEALKNLYQDKFGEEAPVKMTRDGLVYELEQWESMVLSECAEDPDDDLNSVGKYPDKERDGQVSLHPLCPKCSIPMTVKINQATKEEFYGCMRFPKCQECRPLKHGTLPMGQFLKEMDDKKNNAREVRGARSGMSSHSWGRAVATQPAAYSLETGSEVGVANDLTREEIEHLEKFRARRQRASHRELRQRVVQGMTALLTSVASACTLRGCSVELGAP
jgi:ssDNA-binding Zn-finger/Zn-ribbon topoisomerase 1